MSAEATPGSVGGLYEQLACERAGRTRAALAQEASVERLFAASATALEDASAVLLHAAVTFIPIDGRLPELCAEQAGALLAARRALRGGGRPVALGRSRRRRGEDERWPGMRSSATTAIRTPRGTKSSCSTQPRGDWQVLDRSTAATRVIDTLDGDEDGRPQAEAIARDYLATVAQSTPTRGLESTEATPEQGGADAHSDHSRRSRAPRPPSPAGFGAGSGSLTAARSPASCRPSATAPCRSDCCTTTPTAWSSSPPVPGDDGRLQIITRRRDDHFLPGGRRGGEGWRAALTGLAARHAERGEEVFLAPAVRAEARGDKQAVGHTRWLWVDVDQPGQLHALWAFLAERPCHLLVESRRLGRRPRLLEARATAPGDPSP